MILSELYLYPDLTTYPTEITGRFRDRSRSLCNYLERHIKPMKFATPNFKKLCVIGAPQPNPRCAVNSSGALLVEVAFDYDRYASLPISELNEFFIAMLTAGFVKCQKEFAIPVEGLLEGIANFRAVDYVNEWTFKARDFKHLGVKARLHCRLTMDAFSLTLRVQRGEQIVFEQEVLRTVPDEIVFKAKFKDLKERNGTIIVTDKFDEVVYQLDAAALKD